MHRFPTPSHLVAMLSLLSLPLAVSAIGGCGAPARNTDNPTTGGTTSAGGSTSSGGSEASGGSGSGGVTETGGTAGGSGGSDTGGTTASGGSRGGSGGGSGGSAAAGATGKGGSSGGNGGATGKGGSSGGNGGATGTGGATGPGGATGTGGSSSVGGSTGKQGPCDIYQAASTPCVAAHSTVRALYAAYIGALYQVRKSGSVKDIPVASDGYVDIAVQDSFCSGGGCTISIIYDQSPNKNDLTKSPDTLWLKSAKEVNATDGKISIHGHTAYGIYVNNPNANVGYRNNNTKGLAKNDEAEAMYMVLDGKRYSSICCFDYGNATATGRDDGNATMEAIYWGSSTQFQAGGAGTGPWIAMDLENGMFECDTPKTVCSTNTSITGWSYVTAMLKGPSGDSIALKAGNAQSGKLETKWDGKRPPGYSPKKLVGAIILGTGGDGSNYGVGTFWEGAITIGTPPSTVDDEIQANIVAAGYGK